MHEQPLSGVAEAARSIRTNLMFMNPDRPYRKLLVTSAAPSEGKTTVACSIAIALAQGGQRVCIVDCDLRRPRLHRIFDRAGDAGVTNVLVGDATIEEVAKPTLGREPLVDPGRADAAEPGGHAALGALPQVHRGARPSASIASSSTARRSSP